MDQSINLRLEELFNNWCERRCKKALRALLNGWPLSSGLTDDWFNFLESLKTIRAMAQDELTPEEIHTVNTLISEISKIVYR